jgi:hypothetical protein
MGVDSAFDATAQDNWSASHDMFTRRIRRDPVHCNDRMQITARQWFAPQTMSIRIGQAGYSPHFR